MSRPSAAIVHAFVDPVIDLMQVTLGVSARPVSLTMAVELDPPPAITVTIEATGALRGGVIWTFSDTVARDLASRMLMVDADRVDDATLEATAAELANMLAGNATAALHEAGYPIEILPPQVHCRDACRRLPHRALAVDLETARGSLRVLFDLEETARAG